MPKLSTRAPADWAPAAKAADSAGDETRGSWPTARRRAPSCWVSATPMRGTRSRALAADGSDDIVLGILISGQAKSCQGDKEVSFEAGEAVLWPNDAPGEGLYHSPVEFLTLAIPRIVLTQALPDIDDALMRLVPKDNDAVRLLTGYVRLLQGEVGRMSPQLKAASSAHVRDLVALVFGATGDTAEIARGRGARIARLRAVKTDILAHLTRRELSAGMLAARHGISPRYLRTLFESEQTTFTDFVLEQASLWPDTLGYPRDPKRQGRPRRLSAFAAGAVPVPRWAKSPFQPVVSDPQHAMATTVLPFSPGPCAVQPKRRSHPAR